MLLAHLCVCSVYFATASQNSQSLFLVSTTNCFYLTARESNFTHFHSVYKNTETVTAKTFLDYSDKLCMLVEGSGAKGVISLSAQEHFHVIEHLKWSSYCCCDAKGTENGWTDLGFMAHRLIWQQTPVAGSRNQSRTFVHFCALTAQTSV